MKDKNAYFTPMQITQIWQKLSCITVALAGPYEVQGCPMTGLNNWVNDKFCY